MKVTCLECGIQFDAAPSAERRYCSPKCYQKYRTTKQRTEYQEHAKNTIVAHVKKHGPWNKKYSDTNERFQVYRTKHKKKRAEEQIRYYHRPEIKAKYCAKRYALRKQALEALGGKCQRCGFDDIRALQIDHINGGGRKELKHHSQTWFYKRVMETIRKGQEQYQLLCANCNQIKKHERGEFPYANTAP